MVKDTLNNDLYSTKEIEERKDRERERETEETERETPCICSTIKNREMTSRTGFILVLKPLSTKLLECVQKYHIMLLLLGCITGVM